MADEDPTVFEQQTKFHKSTVKGKWHKGEAPKPGSKKSKNPRGGEKTPRGGKKEKKVGSKPKTSEE